MCVWGGVRKATFIFTALLIFGFVWWLRDYKKKKNQKTKTNNKKPQTNKKQKKTKQKYPDMFYWAAFVGFYLECLLLEGVAIMIRLTGFTMWTVS